LTFKIAANLLLNRGVLYYFMSILAYLLAKFTIAVMFI